MTWKGTHTGPLATAAGTIPASGKRQETPAAVFYVFEGAKIKASRHYFDSMTLLKQIGAQSSSSKQVTEGATARAVAPSSDRSSSPPYDRPVKTRVVVLGAGFGGLELATVLSEALGDDVDVTLIDKSDAFVFGYSKLDVMFGRTTLDAVRLPYARHRQARRALRAGDDHRDRSRGAARHHRRAASTRPTSSSSRSAPTTTSTPRRGSPRAATSSTRSPGAERLRELLPGVHRGPRGRRRLRRAVQVPAGAERGGAAAARLPRRRAASATPARSRS